MTITNEPAGLSASIEVDWDSAYACFPTIDRRYLAAALDGLLALCSIICVAMILQSDSLLANGVKWTVALWLILVYEPVLTSRAATVGQLVRRVRVRRQRDGERIRILNAYTRFLVKWLLGWISFLSIPFNARRQGLHDLVVRSLVIECRKVRRYKSIVAVDECEGRMGTVAGPEAR